MGPSDAHTCLARLKVEYEYAGILEPETLVLIIPLGFMAEKHVPNELSYMIYIFQAGHIFMTHSAD